MTLFARVFCVVVALCLPVMALAHAQFKGSEPSPNALVLERPEAVVLWFSEPVSPVAMRWISPGGESFAVGSEPGGKKVSVEPPPDAGDGSYLLAWRVVSLDGHPVSGTLVVSVGVLSEVPTLGSIEWPPASTWSVIFMKFALTVFMTIGIGGTVYYAMVARDIARPDKATTWALYLVFPAAVLLVGAQGLDLLGLPLGAIFSYDAWATGTGTSIIRTAFLAAAAALVAILLRLTGLAKHKGIALVAATLAWLLAASSFSVSGHTATAEPEWQAVTSSTLHGSGLIFWLGAFLPLIRLIKRPGDKLQELQRFSAIAIPLVIVLFASGFFMTSIHTGSGGFQALGLSGYGILLFVKLVAVIGLFVLAIQNRLVLTPAFNAGKDGAAAALRGSIRVEIVLALLIVAFASSFRLTPPPQSLSAQPEPQIIQFVQKDIAAKLTLAPGFVGPNVVELSVMFQNAAPLDPIEVKLGFSMPDKGIGPIFVDASRAEGQEWNTAPFVLPLPGEWDITLELLVTDFDIVTLTTKAVVEP